MTPLRTYFPKPLAWDRQQLAAALRHARRITRRNRDRLFVAANWLTLRARSLTAIAEECSHRKARMLRADAWDLQTISARVREI